MTIYIKRQVSEKKTVQLFLITANKKNFSLKKLIVTAVRMLAFAFGTAVQISVGRMFFL